MMKKILLLSVLFLSVASVSMAALGKEKDKKQKAQTTVKPLLTPQDSLSYAAGLAATNGLMPFLQQEYEMDPAQIAEFVAGFQEALKQIDSPQFKARHAGAAIARMVKNRILPQTTIIRKTKRSEKIKRSDVFRKTKCSFFDFPTHNLKTPQKTLGRFKFLNHKNLTHSSRTLRSPHRQAAPLCAPNYSRICVHFRDSV